MKALITGANGFLGRRVVRSLLGQGAFEVRLVVRSPAPALAAALAKDFPQARLEWCIGDLTEQAFAERAAAGAELVYHLAAGMRGNGPDVIFNTVVGTDNFFAALQRQAVRRVVLVSSFAVYGLQRVGWNHRLTEDSPLEEHPERRDPYTYSKLKQEQLLRQYQLPGVIVRPGVIYGEGGPPLSTRVGLRVGPLFLSLGGRAWLPLTYVENCADAVVLAGLKDGLEGRVINVVDDERLRAGQYRRRYSREVRRLRSIVLPYPLLLALSWALLKYHRWSHGQLPAVLTPYKVAAAWKHCRFDNSTAKTLLGWQPRIGLQEALTRTFADADPAMTATTTKPLRGLLVCSTFPTPHLPNQGLINAAHLQALSKYIQFSVLVPHLYFPFKRQNQYHPAVGCQRLLDGLPITDIRTWCLPLSRGALNGRLYARGIRRALAQLCASFRPDFLLTSFGFPDAVGVGAEARRLGLPTVAILRGTDVHLYSRLPARWRAIVAALNQAALVIPISQSLAAPVLDSGVDRRVQVVHYGVDQTTFHIRDRTETARALGLPAERKRFLFVGNLVPVNRYPTLIDAFASLVRNGNRDTDLYLIGDGPERHRLGEAIARHQLTGRVQLLGEQPHPEVARWLAASHGLCLPSRNEGLPNVILEALASGRPVVATRVGGIPEVMRQGENGLLVAPGDSQSLAEALAAVLDRSWDATALRRSVEQFDWDEDARKLSELIRRSLSS